MFINFCPPNSGQINNTIKQLFYFVFSEMHILIIWFHYNQILEENDFYLWRYIPVHVLHVAASASFMNYSTDLAWLYKSLYVSGCSGICLPWITNTLKKCGLTEIQTKLVKMHTFNFCSRKKHSAGKSLTSRSVLSLPSWMLLLQCCLVCFLLYEKQFEKQISIYYILQKTDTMIQVMVGFNI